eukprot:762197-Pleurochrysis_carterae.AAC.1
MHLALKTRAREAAQYMCAARRTDPSATSSGRTAAGLFQSSHQSSNHCDKQHVCGYSAECTLNQPKVMKALAHIDVRVWSLQSMWSQRCPAT